MAQEISESIQGPAAFAAAFGVSRETIERLSVYAALLAKWQPAINLVAPSTLPHVWQRHFADSAQLLGFAPARRPLHWLDLGPGAGFPGLVIAILLAERVGHRVTLIESDARKAAFLGAVVRETGLGAAVAVDIVVDRIESPANQTRVGPVDVVSARALAPLSKLLPMAAPFFGPETVGLFAKGRAAAAELTAAELAPGFVCTLVPSRTERAAKLVIVRRPVGA
jgi:16S rRNA (guanine527-N7)-methyltransferase